MKTRLVAEVYDDLRTARDWYDEKCDGLGDEFVELFFTVANGLQAGAMHCSIDETGYRPKRMPRFRSDRF